jgi:hypothetical protein
MLSRSAAQCKIYTGGAVIVKFPRFRYDRVLVLVQCGRKITASLLKMLEQPFHNLPHQPESFVAG